MGEATRLRQPGWTDARFVTGLLMVFVSVVIGAAVLGNADRSVTVWAVRHALPAGTTLQADDLTQRRVRLFGDDRARYLDVRGGDPAGRVLTRDVGDGDLLPISALGEGATTATRVVGLPLGRASALGGTVRRGDVVDVLATRKTSGGGVRTYAVATNVRVVAVDKPSGGFGAGRADVVVLVEVAPGLALDLTHALRAAEVDLALVRRGADGPGELGDPVATP